jgi:hypothetical protein
MFDTLGVRDAVFHGPADAQSEVATVRLVENWRGRRP